VLIDEDEATQVLCNVVSRSHLVLDLEVATSEEVTDVGILVADECLEDFSIIRDGGQ
jgi:hypothetical protein